MTIGSIIAMAAGVKSGQSPLGLLALHILVCSLCAGYAVLRQRLAEQETHTLLEVFAFSLGVVVTITWLGGLPILAYLDATVVGICALVAVGRLGCFSAGCCYGVEADIGLVYPHECGGDGKTRRFPVQLLDAAVWALLGCIGWTLVGSTPQGLTLATVLLGYGVARYALEFLRGDRRPHWRGRSLSQWLALVAVFGGGFLSQQLLGWSLGVGVLIAAGLSAWIVMSRPGARWLYPEPSLDRLDGSPKSLATKWSALRPRDIVTEHLDTYVIGGHCTRGETGEVWSLSLSSDEANCRFAEARLVLSALARRLGCEHEGATICRSIQGVYLWQEAEEARLRESRPYASSW